MAIEYVYRNGISVPGVTANVVASELERIGSDGGLTPEKVVEVAANPESPLHSAFEWDDTEAAKQWRLQQARRLLRGVMVVYENAEPIPMHFHITTDDGSRYERIDRVMANKDLYAAALEELNIKVTAAKLAVDQLISIGGKKLRGKKRETANTVRQHLAKADEALAVLS